MRMWRNWYTRTFEGRVALPCEFESRHPHFLPVNSQQLEIVGIDIFGANGGYRSKSLLAPIFFAPKTLFIDY